MTRDEELKKDVDNSVATYTKGYLDTLKVYEQIKEFIPETVKVTLGYHSLTIISDEPTIFLKIAKLYNTMPEKKYSSFAPLGYMKLTTSSGVDIYSSNIDLTDTCEFEQVTETVTRFKPKNCGPWFNKRS